MHVGIIRIQILEPLEVLTGSREIPQVLVAQASVEYRIRVIWPETHRLFAVLECVLERAQVETCEPATEVDFLVCLP